MLVYDETHLREPNLLVPGKRPISICRYAGDWDLYADFLGHRSDGSAPLYMRNRGKQQGVRVYVDGPYGSGFGANEYYCDHNGVSTLVDVGDYQYGAKLLTDDVSGYNSDEGTLHFYWTTNSVITTTFNVWQAHAYNRISFKSTDGTALTVNLNNRETTTTLPYTVETVGRTYALSVAWYDGGTYRRIYLDGVLIAEETGVVASYDNTDDTWVWLCHRYNAEKNWYNGGMALSAHIIGYVRHRQSDAEIIGWHRDPYKFLEAA